MQECKCYISCWFNKCKFYHITEASQSMLLISFLINTFNQDVSNVQPFLITTVDLCSEKLGFLSELLVHSHLIISCMPSIRRSKANTGAETNASALGQLEQWPSGFWLKNGDFSFFICVLSCFWTMMAVFRCFWSFVAGTDEYQGDRKEWWLQNGTIQKTQNWKSGC